MAEPFPKRDRNPSALRRGDSKQPSVYLKMRVLGAVETVEGRTRHQHIHNVSGMSFLDEEGNSRQFTWRTNSAKPHFHDKSSNKRAIYRFCIENGLLRGKEAVDAAVDDLLREKEAGGQ